MIRMSDIYKKIEKDKETPALSPPIQEKKEIPKPEIKNISSQSSAQETMDFIDQTIGTIKDIANPNSAAAVQNPELNLLIEKIVEQQIMDNENLLIILSEKKIKVNPPIGSLKVCTLAVELGIGQSFPKNELVDTGIKALLFDLELRKSQRINSTEKKTDMAKYKKEIEALFLGSALCGGNEKRIQSEIIVLSEIYEIMTSCFSGHEVFTEIINNKQLFDKRLLISLIGRIGPYPVGSAVKLSSGEKGRVIKRNLDMPLRPKVKIIYGIEDRKENEEKIIDLSEHPTLYIKAYLENVNL